MGNKFSSYLNFGKKGRKWSKSSQKISEHVAQTEKYGQRCETGQIKKM